MVKLKRKLCYKGHFESVRSNVVKAVLHYLKNNNILYNDIEIADGSVPEELYSLEEENNDIDSDSSDSENVGDNPLNDHRIGAGETMLFKYLIK